MMKEASKCHSWEEARIRNKFRGREKAKGIGRAGSEAVPAEGPVILWL